MPRQPPASPRRGTGAAARRSRAARASSSSGKPGLAQQALARVQVLLRLLPPAGAGQQADQRGAAPGVEAVEPDEAPRVRQRLLGRRLAGVGREPRDERAQHRRVLPARVLALGDAPRLEVGLRRQVEAFEELAADVSATARSRSVGAASSAPGRAARARSACRSHPAPSAAKATVSRSARMRAGPPSGSSTSARSLLSDQRNAPRGSSGTSQSRLHSRSRRCGRPVATR